MAKQNGLYRLTPDVAAILADIAKAKQCSENIVLEELIRRKAVEMEIIGQSHPENAFGQLTDAIRRWGIPAQEDFTLRVFERIASTPEARTLLEQAWEPAPQQRANKRKQTVNQRLGRFCKGVTGWDSAEEVPLGKGSVELIRSYTRLKPPGGKV